MTFYAPTNGDRCTLHIYDQVLELDAIERGDIEDEVTQALLDGYDPVWTMDALRILTGLRLAVEHEILRCISDARIDFESGDIHPDEAMFWEPTWHEIGKCLGVSAQAAQQRYGKRLHREHSVTESHAPSSPPRRLSPEHPAQAEELIACRPPSKPES